MTWIRSPYPSQVQGAAGGVGGVTDHGALTGLADDDHTQYVHNSSGRTITAQHDFAPGVAQAPFTLGANAQGQKVTGLNSDLLDGLDSLAFALATHTHAASDITSGTLALARGGTNANLSATGGTGQYLKQASAGAAITVGVIATADLPTLNTDDRTRQFCWIVENPVASSGKIEIRVPFACTLVRIGSVTDTGTVTFNIQKRTSIAGSPTDALSSDQVADATGETATSFSSTPFQFAAGDYIVLDIASVASSPTKLSVWAEVTVD